MTTEATTPTHEAPPPPKKRAGQLLGIGSDQATGAWIDQALVLWVLIALVGAMAMPWSRGADNR